MKKRLETYPFSHTFRVGCVQVAPVHMRLEQLNPVIAAHQHSNVSYEIHYTASGHGTAVIGDTTYDIPADTLYVTGPGIIHAQYSDPADPVLEYCLYLNCTSDYRDADDALDLFIRTPFWIGADRGRIRPLLEALLEESRGRHDQPGTEDMSEALLRQIIISLVRIYRQDTPGNTSAEKIPGSSLSSRIPLIEDTFFYQHATLTLAELSDILHVTPRQTQRLLKEYFGKTFSQKLSEARIATARHYLAHTDLSVTAISELVGFSSGEHFSAAFRRQMNMTARDYRKRHRTR